jgi:hypothetical protein
VLLVRLRETGGVELREQGIRERVEVRVDSAGAEFSVYVRHERGQQSTVVNGLRLVGRTPTAFGSSGAVIQVDRADGRRGPESILKTPLHAGDGCPAVQQVGLRRGWRAPPHGETAAHVGRA